MPEGLPIRPVVHTATSESLVEFLVHAGSTESWRPALNLLYFHSSLLALSEEIGLPVLVSVSGDISGLSEVSELLKAQTAAGLSKLTRSWMKEVVPRVLQTIKERRAPVTAGEVSAAMGAEAAAEGGPKEKLVQELMKRGFEDAVTFSGGLSAFFFEFLITKRTAHLTNVLPDVRYERMVSLLLGLNLIEPRLAVSICPNCRNHFFVISDHPAEIPTCTKCGHRWVTVKLYVFRQPFAQLEFGSSLMSVFISAYLRERVNSLSPVLDLEVFPNAEFQLAADRRLEVDVFVPRSALGYECKAFEDVFAPLTGNRLGSVIGRVLPQLQGYMDLGIQNLVVATNLPDASADKVRQELQKKFQAAKSRPKSIVVLAGRPEALVKHLDEVSSTLAKLLNKDFEESFESGSRPKPKRPPSSPP